MPDFVFGTSSKLMKYLQKERTNERKKEKHKKNKHTQKNGILGVSRDIRKDLILSRLFTYLIFNYIVLY